MLKNIRVWCEDGQIKVTWVWDAAEAQRVDIYYKKQDIPGEGGTPFQSGSIYKIPHRENGSASRKLGVENGVYRFAFHVISADNGLMDEILVENIMLGMPLEIVWMWECVRGRQCISFRIPDGKAMQIREIPAGVLHICMENYSYEVSAVLGDGVKLMFPKAILAEEVNLCIKEPYDKVYHLRRA